MPPKPKITQQMILDGAVALVEMQGIDSLSAKNLAKQLNCSTQPIFWHYDSLKDIVNYVENYAEQLFAKYIRNELKDIGAYKAIGINYVLFAKEHKELFKLLLMSNKSGQNILRENANLPYIWQTIQNEYKVPQQTAQQIAQEMWLFAHGMATMIATDTADIDESQVSIMLTEVFRGLLYQHSCKNNN